jgi:5-methylcytosine-specific restriction endonuclease McrA
MKRTSLKRKTPLRSKTRLRAYKPMNKISKKKRQEIQAEKPARAQLEEQAGGLCEHCHQPPDWRGLHPHEKIFRSHSGKLTLENSEMWCGRCHSVDGHNLREA